VSVCVCVCVCGLYIRYRMGYIRERERERERETNCSSFTKFSIKVVKRKKRLIYSFHFDQEMWKLFPIGVLISVLLSVGVDAVDADESKNSFLRKEIFREYDAKVKPDDQVNLKLGVSLLHLDICPHSQVRLNNKLPIKSFSNIGTIFKARSSTNLIKMQGAKTFLL
jgi:hypothetical protein